MEHSGALEMRIRSQILSTLPVFNVQSNVNTYSFNMYPLIGEKFIPLMVYFVLEIKNIRGFPFVEKLSFFVVFLE